jgi:hypothetical protein
MSELKKPRFPCAEAGQVVRVLGHVEGENIPNSSSTTLQATQLAPGAAQRYGPFPNDVTVEITLRDAASLATGTCESVHIKAGDVTVAATVSSRPRDTHLWPTFRYHLLTDQNYISLILATGAAKTHNVYTTIIR